MGDTAAGNGLSGCVAASAASSRAAGVVDGERRVDDRRTRIAFPLRQIPVHRNGTAPIFQQPSVASTRCSEFGNRKGDRRTDLDAADCQRPSPLSGAAVEFSEGQRCRHTVECDHSHRRVIAPLFGELLKFGRRTGFLRQAVWEASSAATCSVLTPIPIPENSVSNPPSRDAGQQPQREHLGADRQPDQRLRVPVEHADVGLVAEAQGFQ